ncbi:MULTISPECIES: YopX family protein [unclassified Bacillus cereus group]|uniref:YopX family protein n=1 Tax=unclassified Bacillus cereus group TaxID=2750818 RepID=UPI001F57BC2C|nr:MULTISPECIES: YopX family protein [unclassified Bacillus cereus group]
MREIKFRVWSKFYNDWVESFCIKDGRVHLGNSVHYPGNQVDDAIIMQYTGSKDKNGRELYELDITKDKFGNIDVICWINSKGAYATIPIDFYLEGNYEYTVVDEFGMDCFFVNNVPEDYLEIIGNVYENPELLEGKQDNHLVDYSEKEIILS